MIRFHAVQRVTDESRSETENLEMKRIHKLSAFKSLPSNPECGHQAIRVEVSVTVVTLLQLDLRKINSLTSFSHTTPVNFGRISSTVS